MSYAFLNLYGFKVNAPKLQAKLRNYVNAKPEIGKCGQVYTWLLVVDL